MSTSQLAYDLAYLSELAYENEADVRADAPLMEELTWLEAKGMQGFLLQQPGRRVLCFRGTQPTCLEDVWADLDAKLMRFNSDAMVHAGFNHAYDDLDEQTRDALGDPVGALPLYVTGHSLGAAMGVVCAARISQKYDITAIHPFGCPRVFDKWGKRLYEHILPGKTTRHVRCCDVVTRIPSQWPDAIVSRIPFVGYFSSGGYRHVGPFIYYDHVGLAHRDTNLVFRERDRLRGRRDHFGTLGTAGIAHHAVNGYVSVTRLNVNRNSQETDT